MKALDYLTKEELALVKNAWKEWDSGPDRTEIKDGWYDFKGLVIRVEFDWKG
jgi:hypothetical protein